MSAADRQQIRLFPLTGTLLLPGTFLPLNVFEPRYRELVADVMADDRRIGLIQPLTPAADNFGPSVVDPEQPPLYDVGCVGEVVECSGALCDEHDLGSSGGCEGRGGVLELVCSADRACGLDVAEIELLAFLVGRNGPCDVGTGSDAGEVQIEFGI